MPRRQPRHALPSQTSLELPLLATLAELGGAAPARDALNRLASRVGLSDEERHARVHAGTAGEVNAFDRHARWARQSLKVAGLVSSQRRGVWSITEKGRRKLGLARPGVVVVAFTTNSGAMLWADAYAAAEVVEKGSVQLFLTSCAYPLLRPKAYGNLDERAHVDWVLGHAERWKELLCESGSFVVNVGDVYRRGIPALSTWIERLTLGLVEDLGFYKVGHFEWENPAKLPSPAEWVTVRRIRCTSSGERCLWFGKTPYPKADNRRVLKPYGRHMRQVLAAGGQGAQARPSGHVSRAGAFGRDNGGAIPGSVLRFANTRSSDPYLRGCRTEGLPVHPARMPPELARFFILLTTEEGDIVADLMSGSGVVPAEAERLKRLWIAGDHAQVYVRGAAHRFSDVPSLRTYFAGREPASNSDLFAVA